MIGEEFHDRRVRRRSHPHDLRETPYNSNEHLVQWFHQVVEEISNRWTHGGMQCKV